MATTRSLFRENLKRLRTLMRLTQAELAERCELSSNYIAELEAGRRFPSPETIDILCESFGVKTYELFVAEADGILLGEREPPYAYKERLRRLLIDSIARFE